MNRVSKLGLAACCSLAFVSVSTAKVMPASSLKEAKAAVKLRQALFDVQNFAFTPMAAMLKGGPFSAKAAVQAGKRIEVTSSMIPEVFSLDTRKFKVSSRARPAIWKNFSSFQNLAEKLNAAAQNLASVAKSGSKSQTLQAAIGVGKACGKCHDDFRLKE